MRKMPWIRVHNTCRCGTRVSIDKLQDILYTGEYEYGYMLSGRILMFGYICPGCESFVKLHIRKSNKIQKALMKIVDIDEYQKLVEDPFTPYSKKFNYCLEHGVPITKRIYEEAILKGDII